MATADSCLPIPFGQDAVGKAQPLGNGVAAEAFLLAELNILILLLNCDKASRLDGVDHLWTVWWSWLEPFRST